VCIDDAAAGDSYVLELTGTAQCPSCTITVDGNPAHSFWGGARVGD
jgi:aerobic-type carbon monoxide dehydrogenase small subunit (CoxS/CutS family)